MHHCAWLVHELSKRAVVRIDVKDVHTVRFIYWYRLLNAFSISITCFDVN